ncbi:hypothetical protein Ple7327_1512 [Pleurocapsa sp. PCC 7327]|uniref:hypothetical protein n=1 Tax=Pleurocapsa sp. PCC 7327 TaxID=118163 RepID=UPI00029FF31C|nr:hypothetical protein [Pleurocapsa sp. PCC 7327]AFY76888.1 hypothetical protein Ple7327_1512 [Pleurocapsa sp. PCC 7327]
MNFFPTPIMRSRNTFAGGLLFYFYPSDRKNRYKTGEVKLGKTVKTETARCRFMI